MLLYLSDKQYDEHYFYYEKSYIFYYNIIVNVIQFCESLYMYIAVQKFGVITHFSYKLAFFETKNVSEGIISQQWCLRQQVF